MHGIVEIGHVFSDAINYFEIDVIQLVHLFIVQSFFVNQANLSIVEWVVAFNWINFSQEK